MMPSTAGDNFPVLVVGISQIKVDSDRIDPNIHIFSMKLN